MQADDPEVQGRSRGEEGEEVGGRETRGRDGRSRGIHADRQTGVAAEIAPTNEGPRNQSAVRRRPGPGGRRATRHRGQRVRIFGRWGQQAEQPGFLSGQQRKEPAGAAPHAQPPRRQHEAVARG